MLVIARCVVSARLPRVGSRTSAFLRLTLPPLSVDVGRDLVPFLQRCRLSIRTPHYLVDDGVLERRLVKLDERRVVEIRIDRPFLEDADVLLDREVALLHRLDLGLRGLGDITMVDTQEVMESYGLYNIGKVKKSIGNDLTFSYLMRISG